MSKSTEHGAALATQLDAKYGAHHRGRACQRAQAQLRKDGFGPNKPAPGKLVRTVLEREYADLAVAEDLKFQGSETMSEAVADLRTAGRL